MEKATCKYFVTRKKRFCRMQPRLNSEFCAEHTKPEEDSSQKDGKIRITCPLDRKHTCYANKLQKHLKICNARAGPQEPFLSPGINSGREEEGSETKDSFRFLSSFGKEQILEVISKIEAIYLKFVEGQITERFGHHDLLEEEMKNPIYGDKTKKHLIQASSILGLLKDFKLLDKESCYIEFGAGRGQLSYWIVKATEKQKNRVALLVERASPKHKKDNKLDKEDEVVRIRADIADLILDQLESIKRSKNIVGVTKHLCGEATDLALRCLTNSPQALGKLTGILMTFCCHHRCSWTSFIGKKFFLENGLTPEDFAMMCSLTSWATSGSGFGREKIEENSQKENEVGLNRVAREEIGRKCKNVMNWGRVTFLQEFGLNCKLHFYVASNVSLENVCIVATKEFVA